MSIPITIQSNTLTKTSWGRLSGLVERAIAESIFPAAAIAIVCEGQWLLDASWGWIDPEKKTIAVTPDSLFDLASVTKLFTTTAFLSTASEHDLDMQISLQSVIPEFGNGAVHVVTDGGQDPDTMAELPTEPGMAGAEIDPVTVTFQHLLTHTAGLAIWRSIFAEAGPVPPPPDEIDPIDRSVRWQNALNALCASGFVGYPGDKIRYSDIGLMLLGEATSRLHGTPGELQRAIYERVVERLNGGTALFNPMLHGVPRQNIVPTEFDATWRKRRVWGEVHDENACGVGGGAGHAGLFANAHTVAMLGETWREDATVFGIKQCLADESRQEQVVTDGIRRGLGWALKAAAGSAAGDMVSESTYGHTGFTGTSLFIDPERELVIVCLTNRVYPGRDKPGIYETRRAIYDLIVREVS